MTRVIIIVTQLQIFQNSGKEVNFLFLEAQFGKSNLLVIHWVFILHLDDFFLHWESNFSILNTNLSLSNQFCFDRSQLWSINPNFLFFCWSSSICCIQSWMLKSQVASRLLSNLTFDSHSSTQIWGWVM